MILEKKQILGWMVVFFSVFAWSVYRPYDFLTWVLEVTPAIIGLIILTVTFKNFKLTPLVYWLILVHAIILMIGGHYTYAREPIFNWLKEVLNLSRNHYDRLGHLAQGFVPAIIARELLIRTSPLKQGRWLFFVVTCVCLAISASYELIECAAAIIGKNATVDFLGTQGDIWDTQFDMAMALVGAIIAQILLGTIHDRQLAEIKQSH